MTEPKHRQDGSIDYDFYRAEAARERREVRNYVVWEVGLPFLWDAPARLLTWAKRIRLHRIRELGSRIPKRRRSEVAGPL